MEPLRGGKKKSPFGGKLRQIEQKRHGIINWVKTAVNHENNNINITTINFSTNSKVVCASEHSL